MVIRKVQAVTTFYLIAFLLMISFVNGALIQVDPQGNVVQSSIDPQLLRQIIDEEVHEEGEETRAEIKIFATQAQAQIDTALAEIKSQKIATILAIIGSVVLGLLFFSLITYLIGKKKRKLEAQLYEVRMAEWYALIEERVKKIEAKHG